MEDDIYSHEKKARLLGIIGVVIALLILVVFGWLAWNEYGLAEDARVCRENGFIPIRTSEKGVVCVSKRLVDDEGLPFLDASNFSV